MVKPKRPKLPSNCGQIRLFIDSDGNVSGDLAWNFEPDTPEEFVFAMQDYVHGLMSMILTDPERVAEMGKSYAAGLDSRDLEEDDDETEFTFGDEEIFPVDSSDRRH